MFVQAVGTVDLGFFGLARGWHVGVRGTALQQRQDNLRPDNFFNFIYLQLRENRYISLLLVSRLSPRYSEIGPD